MGKGCEKRDGVRNREIDEERGKGKGPGRGIRDKGPRKGIRKRDED
jgi:hypothetical protein